MNPLQKRLRSKRFAPPALLGGSVVAASLFAIMALSQMQIDFTPPPEPSPIQEYYLPPPPPPPPTPKVEKPKPVPIALGIQPEIGPGEIPLGFLEVDFGLKPKKITQTQVDKLDSIENFDTGGLEDLVVYDYDDVTEKPSRYYEPKLDFDARDIDFTYKPFSFLVICRITSRGRTENIHIIDCPYPKAVPEIRAWVQGWRYEPAMKDGKPVDVIVRRRITYNPSGSGSPFSA